MDGCVGQRTVGHCTNERSGEKFFLGEVHQRCDLWSAGIIRPGLFRRVRHGSDEGNSRDCRGEGGSGANDEDLEVR